MLNRGSLFFLIVIFLSGSCALPPHGPRITNAGVRFSFFAPKAKYVTIAGNFNRWDQRALSGPDRRGFWSITLPLPKGRYEYLFILDGETWQTDPAALTVNDGMGGKNSYLEVVK